MIVNFRIKSRGAELHFSVSPIDVLTKVEVWSVSLVGYKKLLSGSFFKI